MLVNPFSQSEAETIGNDGMQLLIAVWESPALSYLRHLPSMEILRPTWVHQYYVENDQVRLRAAADLPPAGKRSDSPSLSNMSLSFLYIHGGSIAHLLIPVSCSITCCDPLPPSIPDQ
jgi:hypothetical protein